MPFYSDADTFYIVMTDLFGRVMAAPEVLKPLTDSKVLLRMTVSAPDAVLIVDGRAKPPCFITGAATPSSGQPDIGLRVPADVLHNAWLSRIRLQDAYMTGKMRLDTSPLRALALMSSLTGMMRCTEQIYPQVLRERGLLK